jgi:uncharacterized membrane protein YfcA
MISIPLLSQVMSPLRAAGLMLPILIFGDLLAIHAYRKTFSADVLKLMIPAGFVGILLGWLTATWIDDNTVRLMLGVMCLAAAADFVIRHRREGGPAQPGKVFGFICGILSGFTSFFANIGGPPFQIYVGALRLDRLTFTGTSVFFFFSMNLIKLGPYFELGQINPDNLAVTLMVLPVTLVAVRAAVWFLRRINDVVFYRLVYATLFLIGLKTTYDGVMGLLA